MLSTLVKPQMLVPALGRNFFLGSTSEQQTALSNRNSIQPVYMGLPNLFYFCQPLSVFVVTELLYIIQSSQVLQEAFNRCVAVLTHSSKPDDMSVQVSCSNFNLYQSSEKLCMYIF